MKRTASSYLLMALLVFLALGAIPAGMGLVWDPSGSAIGFPPQLLEELKNSPFRNFLVPGLFLLLFLGLLPVFTAYGLITKKRIKGLQRINPYKKQHWSWTLSYYLGLLLILWINMQLFFGIGFHLLHFLYALLGVLIVFVALLPGTQREYSVF